MARPNRLREKIAAGKTCVGPLFQEFWSPELFEFCAMAGFDFLIADGEHAGVDPQGVRNLARAAQGAGATALARVPNGEPSLILRYLDAGVEGLILPHCNSAADAEGLVRASRYPPRGIRGAVEIQELGELRADGFDVGLDLVLGEQRALGRFAARVADAAGGAARDGNGMMPVVLEAAQREQRHQMPDVQRIRRGIKAAVERDGRRRKAFRQLGHIGAIGEEAAPLQFIQNVHGRAG